MNFTAVLLTTVACAVNIEGEKMSLNYNLDGKPSFDIGRRHREADYSSDYGETLPGADFNRQVYRFRENRQIWD